MSDVSVRSHEYQTASELSQALNGSLIVLKKAALRSQEVAAHELECARVRLAQIADALAVLLASCAPLVVGARLAVETILVRSPDGHAVAGTS